MWRELLADGGLPFGEKQQSQLERYAALIQEWNRVVSLVSAGDMQYLWPHHVLDSLSLAPYLVRERMPTRELMDIGSGAGFPAIPLKVVLPDLTVTLLERSERKVGFLLKAVRALDLDGVEVVCGEFPGAARGSLRGAVTARAIERPEKVVPRILDALEPGAVFVCQTPGAGRAKKERFHVEHVQDAWTQHGIRRGELRLIRRIQTRHE